MTGIEIRWTEEAEITFDHIVSYILDFWGLESAEKFIIHTKSILSAINQQPDMYAQIGISGVRRCVITKQTSLFYELRNTKVVLLYFWDNRQDPLFI